MGAGLSGPHVILKTKGQAAIATQSQQKSLQAASFELRMRAIESSAPKNEALDRRHRGTSGPEASAIFTRQELEFLASLKSDWRRLYQIELARLLKGGDNSSVARQPSR
jgi:hypothetical protein